MARVCINNCGLEIDSNGALGVNTAGPWPYAGTPATTGQAIYCDPSSGGLYASPGYVRPAAHTDFVFATSGTLNAADVSGAIGLRVRVVGAGGGGGGAAATSSVQSSMGSGGGGGGYAEATLPIASVTFPVTVTVATGSAGVTTGTAATPGNSSFGSLVVASSGAGGVSQAAFGATGLIAGSASPGAGTTGQILLAGEFGRNVSSFIAGTATAGSGGSAGGGMGTAAPVPNTNSNGNAPGLGFGAGGTGGNNGVSSGATRTGGSGGNGVVIVEVLY